ncbi:MULTISPECIES: DUF6643 family protein [Streptomyces]|uniref:DUF6643 family protein n=1 Tax=Streptomyces flaveolus TaxID=67297 RepID=A0ABV3AEL6_9ACTN|nr:MULTISPECIES: DUF6643 family protein [Streptomyces]KMS83613.1 hypothetical protein ACZ91_50675 [Streptomyces regensis]KOG64329.1 hypothetical protein ADK77_21225 [Streptomyces antibioticus]KOV77723.1 hypothetical protein ADL02_26550 [Streptomyces sp. NRRL WC-3723]
MTSPRSTYGGGYYSASFPDTPIYDSLVAERGTPQIAPIRVPAAYDTGSSLPALPSALPALPAAPAQQQPPAYGYPQQQPAPLQQAPTAYIPQQASAPRGYPGPQAPQQQRPMAQGNGYEAMRPAAPRPAPAPYQDPYNNQQYRGY